MSNQRQVGLTMAMYAEDFRGELPPSRFLQAGLEKEGEFKRRSHETVQVFVAAPTVATSAIPMPKSWDGLGLLYQTEHLRMPELLYCPSHAGPNRFQNFEPAWRSPGSGTILTTYLFRGGLEGENAERGVGAVGLWHLDPMFSLMSDSVRAQSELNHSNGMNILQAGLSVRWYSDSGGVLQNMLPKDVDERSGDWVDFAWRRFDTVVGGRQTILSHQ